MRSANKPRVVEEERQDEAQEQDDEAREGRKPVFGTLEPKWRGRHQVLAAAFEALVRRALNVIFVLLLENSDAP
jgi:hypothetical protein